MLLKYALSLLLLTPIIGFTNQRPSIELVKSPQERHVLVLYYTPSCPYCQKVLNYLKKVRKTVPMKNVRADLQAKEELRCYGGKMQVPCLFIDGHPLYESQDIINWMETHPDDLDTTPG